jgi:alkylhydroperoxidase/carboxymuconolactone decarboxylase family protein YurZ
LEDAPPSARAKLSRGVDPAEQLLRRLALNDEKTIGMVLAGEPGADVDEALIPKVDLLIRLGALVALGASTPSLQRTVELAQAAGATDEELVGVLVAVAPTVGLARVVAAAPRLAVAIGYDSPGEE